MKKIVAAIAIVVVAVGIIAGVLISRHNANNIGKDKALEIALQDAGFNKGAVYDIDTDYEKEAGRSYYEVEFKADGMEYNYVVDAVNGNILGSSSEVD